LKIRFFSLKNNRIISIILIAILMMQIIMPPTSLVAYANSNCNVTFQNYDLSYCNEDINSAPLGTSLYHGEELVEKGVLEPDSLTEGYTYYLYGEELLNGEDYGPIAIKDPTRSGYVFKDWIAVGKENAVHTVAGDTNFIARYSSDKTYIVNLYYQYETGSIAAKTNTCVLTWEESKEVTLPTENLTGLTPKIKSNIESEESTNAIEELNSNIINNKFSFKINDDFLFM